MTIRTLVVSIALVFSNNLVAQAHHLSQEQINQCIVDCVGQVLAGQRELTQCISLPLVTRQIVGPVARSKSDSDLNPIAYVVERILRERIDRYAEDFRGSQIEVDYHQESSRQPHVYGVEGTLRQASGTTYNFSGNGHFVSPSNCSMYTLSVGPINLNRWLREQEEIDSIIQDSIRGWGY